MSLQTSPSAPPAIVERFDPFSAEYLADPYPILRELRGRHGRLLIRPRSLGRHTLRRRPAYPKTTKFFRDELARAAHEAAPARCLAMKEGGYAATPALTNLDPPGHARQRRLANAAFTPKRIAALEPFIRDLARRFLDEHFHDGSADHNRRPACAFPALVVFEVLARPESDLDRVRRALATAAP